MKILNLLLLLPFVACEQKTLQPLESLYLSDLQYATAEADFCTKPSNEFRQRLKYIFVMDKSASNNNAGDPSDPSGLRRYAPLSNFIDNATANLGYTFYSLINFNNTATVVQNFTDDKVIFQNKVRSEWNAKGLETPDDDGYTNYVSAIRAVSQLIEDDVVAQKKALDPNIHGSVYVVIFVSDGYPWVLDAAQPTQQRKQIYDPEIKTEINTLLSHKENAYFKAYVDDIRFHAGYYYNLAQDSDAKDILGQMAAQGSGDLFTFGGGASIDFKKFAVPVRHVRFTLSDVFVENTSATWWDDGRYLRDTDGDGLPDAIEQQYGSNFQAKDSDGNGVSDFVEFRMKGTPCKDAHCRVEVTLRDNYTACAGLLPKTTPEGAPNPRPDGVNTIPGTGTNFFSDLDADGLNDCEEFLLRSDKTSFDSNQDHLPDFLEMKAQIPFIIGAKSIQSSPAGDQISNYKKAKEHLPIYISREKIPDFKEIQYDLRQVDSADETACYHLRAKNIAILGNDNLIRISATMNTSVIEIKPVISVTEGVLKGTAKEITFEKGDFK